MSEPNSHITAANVVAWSGVGLSRFLDSIGIHTWGDFAAMCAALLSVVTLADWAWKKWKNRK
jgi:hypothetical protein